MDSNLVLKHGYVVYALPRDTVCGSRLRLEHRLGRDRIDSDEMVDDGPDRAERVFGVFPSRELWVRLMHQETESRIGPPLLVVDLGQMSIHFHELAVTQVVHGLPSGLGRFDDPALKRKDSQQSDVRGIGKIRPPLPSHPGG